ncbi:MAG: hypothetical protein J5669_02210 [Bacteroidales bacterium]|nr:hypothetical protein [Bacteroidales bacterium]
MRKIVVIVAVLLAALLPARAQFVLTGDDPGYLRWFSVETPHYQIIYPTGADSLARNYGTLLERYRLSIGRSLSVETGKGYKLPVVLHTHNPYSNGSVAWAPSRMDLYTLPHAYGSDPTPWDVQLAIHEPRHQAQMELPRNGFLKPATWFLGETWAPAVWFAYISRCLSEGDAVTVETALSPGSRARTADFLNYYQVALDQGDFRNWYRWRYGSYKYYAPDYYALGYLTLAGSRYLTDAPLLMSEALQESRKHPWMFSTANLKKVVRQHTGHPFKREFMEVLETYKNIWEQDAQERTPFMPQERITREESFPVEYSTPALLNGTIYLLRRGYLRTPQLGYLRDGVFIQLMPFASSTSALFPDENSGRLYWSETLPNPRWSLDGKSVIRYYDIYQNKVRDLTHEGRLYNPQPSPDGTVLAAVEYPFAGGSAVVVLDAATGAILRRITAPDGIQVSESAWLDGTIYVSGISMGGYGIYAISPEGEWSTQLEPGIQKVVNLHYGEGWIEWVSDRDGTNALYRYFPATGELFQRSSTRYGATDFCEADGWLYSISQTRGGRMLFRTPVDSLPSRQVSYADVHRYPVEDAITRQESSLGPLEDASTVEFSEPKRYYKFPHLMRFHSWAPAYVDYDAVESASFDFSFETASPGLSAYFQNTLSTMSGMVGYAFRPDSENSKVWRHSLHARFTYSGWYPVFEGAVHFGDTQATQYNQVVLVRDNMAGLQLPGFDRGVPQLSGYLRVYLPLAWSKGGIRYGFIPQVSYSLSNNLFDNGLFLLGYPRQLRTEDNAPVFTPMKAQPANMVPMQRLTASARGYVMLPRARSQVYPRWGVGFEGGFNIRTGMTSLFTPNVYGYVYGYTPGLFRTQGLRLSGMWQHQLRSDDYLFQLGENAASTLPRGFSSTANTMIPRSFDTQLKLTADYAIPIFVGDLALPPVLYVRNFLLIPHFDYTLLFQPADQAAKSIDPGPYNLWSVGADFTAELGKLLMIPFDGSLGLSFSYLGGSAYETSKQSRPWSLRLIMSFDFK